MCARARDVLCCSLNNLTERLLLALLLSQCHRALGRPGEPGAAAPGMHGAAACGRGQRRTRARARSSRALAVRNVGRTDDGGRLSQQRRPLRHAAASGALARIHASTHPCARVHAPSLHSGQRSGPAHGHAVMRRVTTLEARTGCPGSLITLPSSCGVEQQLPMVYHRREAATASTAVTQPPACSSGGVVGRSRVCFGPWAACFLPPLQKLDPPPHDARRHNTRRSSLRSVSLPLLLTALRASLFVAELSLCHRLLALLSRSFAELLSDFALSCRAASQSFSATCRSLVAQLLFLSLSLLVTEPLSLPSLSALSLSLSPLSLSSLSASSPRACRFSARACDR